MKKKLLTGFLAIALVFTITGCGKEKLQEEKSKGKCSVFECMEKLESSQTLEQMNKIIGLEGVLKSETDSYKTYSWELSENTSITSQFMLKYDTATITANFPTTMASHKADFSKWDEIKSSLNKKDSIKYDEFVKLVGGVEGTIKSKSSSGTSYVWYNSDGGYLTAYFNPETKKCTMATGRF